jgi:hypothetical protein
VAGSTASTWVKGFSERQEGSAGGAASFAELVGEIGGELVRFPPGDDGVSMPRRELLARALWTRAVIDGDMTAIKVLIECLSGRTDDAADGGITFNADHFAAARRALQAWRAVGQADGEEGDDDGETA